MKQPRKPSPRAEALHRNVLRWYRRSGRRLPWRRTRNPYRILVSEIMLQQTQVSRVLSHYPGFLKKFPDFWRLARASTADVLRAWRGMGYNNRAVRLRSLAKTVTERHHGKLPSSIGELRSLPGIGRYTAHAVACFAFAAHAPVVDTNIARVLSRLYPSGSDAWEIADRVLPKMDAYTWNQALMDLGAGICTASSPDCGSCPLSRLCPSAYRIARSKNPAPRKEPGRNGIPNRIYRGRIVDVLRGRNGSGAISSEKLGRLINPAFSPRDKRWLKQLLSSLEKDGVILVKQTPKRKTISFAR